MNANHRQGQGVPTILEYSAHRIPAHLIDLHLHQERWARLNQARAESGTETARDWTDWVTSTMQLPKGMPRLIELWNSLPPDSKKESSDLMIRRFTLVLAEAAAAGAILAEVRVGNDTILAPEALECFRQAESDVRQVFPNFFAGLVVTFKMWQDESSLRSAVEKCLQAGPLGPSGVDFVYLPYDTEADFRLASEFSRALSEGGLGVTAHAGEFSKANILNALRLPGLTRLGHALHAAGDQRILDKMASLGVAVECCLTSNIILGAAGSFKSHPILRLRDAGIPIVLGTDDPLHFQTNIALEYTRAAAIGMSYAELEKISVEAAKRAFVTEDARTATLATLSAAA